jgi:hypothetical protein
MAIKHIILLFVETPRKFITAKLSIRAPGSSSVKRLVISPKRLVSDITLPQRANLSPENVYDLLKLCLTTTCFNGGRNYVNKHTALQWEVHCRLLWLICSWRNLKRRP